ncbi:hypothetical protein CDL12_07390 [Handroanthus impetiginosus]|uniref:Uncharacterized protein n=1 Tax=Handroanthus impetiginosus TaxID=429701 RepID=A0A2G9HQW3_9LAMI|nr:hypothetical protein CDL12_07390 [Handroanthus impetiginosus]
MAIIQIKTIVRNILNQIQQSAIPFGPNWCAIQLQLLKNPSYQVISTILHPSFLKIFKKFSTLSSLESSSSILTLSNTNDRFYQLYFPFSGPNIECVQRILK